MFFWPFLCDFQKKKVFALLRPENTRLLRVLKKKAVVLKWNSEKGNRSSTPSIRFVWVKFTRNLRSFSSKSNQYKSNILLCSLCYTEACNQLAGPIFESLRPKLLLKKCRSSGERLATFCPIWPVQYLNLKPPALETKSQTVKFLKNLYRHFAFYIKLEVE